MLIRHDTIYLGADGASTDALLVRDGEVRATGERAVEWSTSDERVVRPEGAALFPGLADAHCHLWGLGRRAGSVRLDGAESWSEVLEALRGIGDDDLPTEWVLGRGWDEHGWPDPEPAWREDLDDLFPNRPVSLHRVDRHAVAVNTEALRRADLLEGGEPAAGGRLDRDPGGRPTGLLVDDAMDPVLDAVPPPDRREDRRMFLEAADRYLDYGITCVHIARSEVDRIRMLESMHASGELPLRMYVLAEARDDDLPGLLREGPRRDPTAEFACRGVKFFADGALGSSGALLLGSYRDGSSGLEVTPREELLDRIPALLEAGWQVAAHAIGDRAARNVLDAVEGADRVDRDRLRPRLEHAQMLADADCERMEELSVVASIQPIHMYSDAAWAGEVLDGEQLDRLFRWRTLDDRTTLAAGSDFPIEDPNPWHGLAAAVSRRTADGGTFRPDEGLDRHRALAAYTTGAARAAHWEDRLGRLRPGYAADVLALDRDPFEVSPDELYETNVLETRIAGELQ